MLKSRLFPVLLAATLVALAPQWLPMLGAEPAFGDSEDREREEARKAEEAKIKGKDDALRAAKSPSDAKIKAVESPKAQEAAESKKDPAELVSDRIDAQITELKLITTLIKDLDGNRFEQRRQAVEKLCRIGSPAVEPLKMYLEAKPSLEATNRALNVLRTITANNQTSKLKTKLAEPIDLNEGIPLNTPLRDALDFLSDKTGVAIILDSKALASILDNVPPEKAGEQLVFLPKMTGVKLSTVLRKVLDQIEGNGARATYRLRDEYVEITTTRHTNPRAWTGNRNLVPGVEAKLVQIPLMLALGELSDRTGISIVVDQRMADAAATLVTADLDDVPLDTAVRMLTDMTNLKMVALDNVIYVTSVRNAKVMEAEQRERDAEARTQFEKDVEKLKEKEGDK